MGSGPSFLLRDGIRVRLFWWIAALDPDNLKPDPQLGMHYAYRDRHTAGILLGAIKHIDKEVAFDSETYLDKCYLIY